MGLFKPAWMGTNKEKALASVAKLIDKEKLARAAMNAPLDEVCVVAARRLMSRHYEGFLTVLYKAPRASSLLISNDCHVNPHSDNPRGVHTDNNRKNEILYRFPSFVKNEEKTAKTETAAMQ